jgi:L-alanine-DL-glutamate epimerase-like enolase superfamily enzyme
MTYPTRDYVAVEVESADGRVGSAIGYTRGTPLLEATRLMAQALDPRLAEDPEAATADLAARFAPGWGALVRGASLLDIALWDLVAQGAGTDVGTSLGGTPTTVPWMLVAGYFPRDRGQDVLVAEAVQFAREGAGIVKVMLTVDDPVGDRRLLEALREALGPAAPLAVDFHGAHREPEAAADMLAGLERFHLMFVEDPFPGHDLGRLARLAELTDVPIAVGEDLVEETALDGLLEIATHLRVDATASGGLSFARRAVRRAEAAGRTVLPHVFEPIHLSLAALGPTVIATERIPAQIGADPFPSLLSSLDRRAGLPLAFVRAVLDRQALASWRLEI